MPATVALLITITLSGLGLVHIYWALGSHVASRAAIPEIEGHPVFSPSKVATFAVAIALLAAAFLVAVTGHLVVLALAPIARLPTFFLSIVFLARAVGDFRLVGFFKRIRDSRFARLDTSVYSPFCLALALATFYVAYAEV